MSSKRGVAGVVSMDFTVTGRLVGLRGLPEADDGIGIGSGIGIGTSVVELSSGELVGHAALSGATAEDRCATLEVMIGAPYQGRGLGTDAVRTIVHYGFAELGLHRVQLSVDGDNPAAIAVFGKAGFVEEGRRREALSRGGLWWDEVHMGLLAREYQAAGGRSGASAGLRIEVFVADLDAFVDFYTRVLGFGLADDRRTTDSPYAAVALGSARIGAVRSWSAVDPAARSVPSGAELVLEVDDIEAAHRGAADSGWPLAGGLTRQPWGLRDFRLFDPDGYYVRVTSR